RTVEERGWGRRVDPHELACLFAAAVVFRMAVIGWRGRFVSVTMLMTSVRVEMPAADDRENLRLAVRRRRGDMPVMPATADQRMHQQRSGGDGGDQRTHGPAMPEVMVDDPVKA